MRTSGILMHISSLPSAYGIGTLGKEAEKFVDFLVDAGQTYWQVLPMGPTGYGDSPYQSFSTYAGNPYFIDLKLLCEDGLLTQEACEDAYWGEDETKVDYGAVYWYRNRVLRLVQKRFFADPPKAYEQFCEEQKDWLDDYSMYMALKEANDGNPWCRWPEALKRREPKALAEASLNYETDIQFYKMTQFLFYKQWERLKAYANDRGIQIIGDIPIYVSSDSSDVWSSPEQFYLDENLDPIAVAGCPPDGFTEDGQLWGNPLFRWDVMEADGFSWWMRRVKHLSNMFDVIRIDHFRGFESYYAVPYGDKNARRGSWKKGPGLKLFHALEEKLGALHIIVEDLGFLTPEVLKMVEDCGYPGMKLLQFAFDGGRGDNAYLPHNHIKNSVVYTGSHDNDTILGWLAHAPAWAVEYAAEYMQLSKEEPNWGMMRTALASVADTAVLTMQDLLDLGSEARMNTPSTTGDNWKWRMRPGVCTPQLAQRIRHEVINYGRCR